MLRATRTTRRREDLVFALAVAAGLAIALADLLSQGAVSHTTMLVAVPLIACTECSRLRTAATGVGSVVLAAALSLVDEAMGAQEMASRVLAVAMGSAIAVLLAVGRERRERRLDDLDSFAGIAQELIQRPVPPRLGNVYAAGRYVAASDILAIGGDLYDVALTPSGVRFIVGDACGKGLNGIRLAAQVLARFREAVFVETDVRAIAIRLDELVEAIAQRSGRDADFVTAVIGELREDGSLTIASCGHPDGLVARGTETAVVAPAVRTVPLGLGADPTLHRIQLQVGDRLLWWTDGVSEARDAEGEFLDVETAAGSLTTSPTLELGLDAVLERVREHARGHLDDDVAVLGFELGSATESKPWLQSVLAGRRDAIADAQAEVAASHETTSARAE